MDNDDNDYQGQNLHIVGEERSQISSVLHPYALPKFDFDDSLQLHLRFDSLVENEVFLGIPSQEENNWIEDFSRGSSGIEFNTSAAEPCSIPRRNNVWSEATSSESVEMLLKSVGQEAMVPGEPVTEHSGISDELGAPPKQMEPNLKQDDKNDDQDLDQALPAVVLLGNAHGMDQSARVVDVDLKCASETQEVQQSAFDCPVANIEKCSLVFSEDIVHNGATHDNKNREKAGSSLNESLNNKMEEALINSATLSSEEWSSQKFNEDVMNLSDQDKVSDNHLVGATIQPDEICKGLQEENPVNNDSSVNDGSVSRSLAHIPTLGDDSQLYVSAKMEATQEHVESSVRESSSFLEKSESILPTAEGNNQDLKSVSHGCQTSAVLVISETNATDTRNESSVASQVDEFDMHATVSRVVEADALHADLERAKSSFLQTDGNSSVTEVDKPNELSVASQVDEFDMHATVSRVVEADALDADLERAKSSLLQTDGHSSVTEVEKLCGESHGSMNRATPDTTSEAYTSRVDGEPQKQVSECSRTHVDSLPSSTASLHEQVAESSTTRVQDHPSLTAMSVSAEIVPEKHVIENPKVDNAGAHGEAVSSYVQARMLMSVDDMSPDKIDILNRGQDVSVSQKGDQRNVDSEADVQRLSPLSLDEEGRKSVETPLGVKLDYPMTNQSVSDPAVSDTNFVSADTSDEVPMPSMTGATEEITNPNKEQESLSPVILSMDVGKQEEMGVGVPSEANMSDPKEPLCVEGASHGSEGEKSTCSNVTPGLVIKVDESIPTGDTYNTGSQDVREAADKRTEEGSSQKIEVDPIRCGSKLAEGADVEAAAEGMHQETEIENNGKELPKASGAGSFVDNKPNHDSARLGCTVLPETEKGPTSVGLENVAHYGSTHEVGDKAASTPVSGGVNDTCREERSFTFDVRPLTGLSEGDTRSSWQSFPNIKACSMSKIEKSSSPTSVDNQKDHNAVQGSSHATPQASESASRAVGVKSSSERKPRRGPAKAGKDSKKGDAVKETPVRKSLREDKQFAAVSHSGTGQLLQFEAGNTERGGAKPTAPSSVSTSNLPDLNTSVPTTVLFHQPFTDLQQVQLRAQIFVYGSLIQGAPPEEACMVSAFGASDGGRSAWEPSWRACLERLHGQKSIANNHDTPVQSRSGSKGQDHLTKQALPQSRALPSPASRLSSKGTPPAVNPVIPLSSPLWNISTPSCDGLPSGSVARGAVLDYQALPPLHPYQVSPMRPFGAHTTTWLSQAPFPSPWVASQSSPFDFSARFSSLPTTETVKLTPFKDPSLAISSGSKQSPTTPVGGGSNTFGGTSTMHDVKKIAGPPVLHSADPKSRKRKKGNIIEDPVQISPTATMAGALSSPVISHSSKKSSAVELGPITLLARNQRESVFAPVISSHFSTSVAVTASPSCLPMSGSDKFLVSASPSMSSTNHIKRMDMEKVDMHGENFRKVEEAKQQAVEASAHAASAISCCQNVWSQLDKHRNLSLVTEEKLASAAVAIAAAAAVAKAAAAAAKIASNAALQAKQMADEALSSKGTDIPVRENTLFSPSISNSLENATTPSILKGVEGSTGSNLIISSAREAARRRLEATSAAAKHAENLDAIVKAAELAAEAVSQAGFVVSMGQPLPLNVLAGAGPERYWKGSEVPSGHVVKCGTEKGGKSNTESLTEVPVLSEGHSDQGIDTKDRGRSPIPREISMNMENIRSEEDKPTVDCSKKDSSKKKDRRASDIAKAIRSKPGPETGSIQDAQENGESILNDNNIKEGCLVEVFKEGGRFKGAWYVANVLSLDTGKALVCYNELQSDEGSELLREWVPLRGEGTDLPLIRVPHPVTSMGVEGTRKRRRAVLTDYNWSVGDRVDVWVEDCWREGIITGRNKKDQTSLTIQFPAQGETSVVRAWHLRPTLVWKDGEWIELPSSSQNAPSQTDTPQDKRQKLGSPVIEGKGKGKIARSMDVIESEQDDSKLLPLSKSEKVFNIGSNKVGNNADAPRVMRSGLQKEGSKVFGVPKPGKKRKFMEVSKHYSEGTLKNNVSGDSVKFSKYIMPQGLGSRGWKSTSKHDPKEKQTAELKSKAHKSGKLPSVSSRTLPQKEKSSIPSVAASHATTMDGFTVEDSKNVNDLGQQNQAEFGAVSSTEEVTEASHSSQDLASRANKKAFTSSKSERLTKGKLVQAGMKSTKVEVKDKSIPDATEPRRSNRKIQPTSRLLEGLQSSLIISKVPSSSHDKIHRSRALRGTGNRG